VRRRVIGPQPDGPAQRTGRARFTPPLQQMAEIVPGRRRGRIDQQGGPDAGERLVDFPHLVQRIAEIDPAEDGARLQQDDAAQADGGLL